MRPYATFTNTKSAATDTKSNVIWWDPFADVHSGVTALYPKSNTIAVANYVTNAGTYGDDFG